MAAPEQNLAGPGRLVESRRALDTRIIVFHFLIGAALLVLGGGLAYRQLIQTGQYDRSERQQTERRIVMPGPRGNIYDRNHRLLVGNRPRFSAVLYLDQLQGEFRTEALRIRRNFRAAGDSDVTVGQVEELARVSVVQRYFDQACAIAHRAQDLDVKGLKEHFQRDLLVPFPLLDDLTPDEFARLLEGAPVRSPLQLAVTEERTYPFGSLASHVLGYVQAVDNVDASALPGSDLTTLRLRGTVGADGLEEQFDAQLEGRPGVAIYRVDPSGYKVNPPLEQRRPLPGRDLVTSIDADLQQVAEAKLLPFLDPDGGTAESGSVIALDVRTGEVLVLASKPDYDLNNFPHDAKIVAQVSAEKGWTDRAIAARYHPGSTFKLLVSIAGLQSGRLDPNDDSVDCPVDERSVLRIGNHNFACDNGNGHHGHLKLAQAIADSCDIYYYAHGLAIGPDLIVQEAHRMHLDGRTGIELPHEIRSRLPNLAGLRKENAWHDGDTAEISIGQGPIDETPLNLACFAASLARGETWTHPTLLHDPNRPAQHSEPIGLTAGQLAIIRQGMEECITGGAKATGSPLNLPIFSVPGVQIACKTGTATLEDKTDSAWFICYAPAGRPRIAVAVQLKGKNPGETFGGGINAGPVAVAVLQKYFEKVRRESPASAQTADSPSPGSPSPAL